MTTNIEFLGAVFGSDAARAHVCSFDCDPADAGPRWAGGAAGTFGPRAGLLPENNNYFCISTFSGGRRRKRDFVATHVIVVDDVGSGKSAKVDPARLGGLGSPSYRIETSPGNEQWGYVLATPETDAGRVNALLEGMVASGLTLDGRDPGMLGVTRYVRLPVGRNTKARYGAGGFEVVLAHFDVALRFEMEDLARGFGLGLPAAGVRGSGGGAGGAGGGTYAGRAGADEVFLALEAFGMVRDGGAPDGANVKYQIDCPWEDGHSDGRLDGAAYWLGGGFDCKHGHCVGRGRRELAAWVNDERVARGMGPLAAFDFPVIEDEPTGAQVMAAQGVAARGVAGEVWDALVYFEPKDMFWKFETRALVPRAAVDVAWGPRMIADGVIGAKEKASKWLVGENVFRVRLADAVSYWPGREAYYEHVGLKWVNKWRAPWGLDLRGGGGGWARVQDAEVAEWLMLVRYVCSGSEAWVGDALLDWMAAAVGAPEIKVGWHVIVHSGQGLGKDMMIQPVVAGVGEQNVGRVNAKGLNSDFNNYAGQKFIVVSELKQTTSGAATGADQYNTLKELTETANDYIQINPKYGVQFVARNLGAYYVTSNNDVPVKLAEDDRRFIVVDAQRVRPLDVSFYAGLAAWMKGSGGAGTARCAQWLAQRWREVVADDAGGGGRLRALRGNAPMTAGKQAMVRLSRDPVEVWIEEQVAAGGAWPDLMTSEDVARAVGTAAREGVHGFKYVPPPHRLGAILVKLGGGKVYGGSPVRLKDGSRSRVWATREPERFAWLDGGAIAQAYISAAGHSFSDVSEGGGDDGKVVTLASVTDENKCDRFSVDI